MNHGWDVDCLDGCFNWAVVSWTKRVSSSIPIFKRKKFGWGGLVVLGIRYSVFLSPIASILNISKLRNSKFHISPLLSYIGLFK